MARTITSLVGYIRKLSSISPKRNESLLFRGHPKREYELTPSVFRETKARSNEHRIVRELVASYPVEFSSDETTLERLVRVQHYSLPTRLMDVTWNPLVALYFCCAEHPDNTGEILVFRTKRSAIKYYDSDTVSCVSNLAHLSSRERDQIRSLLKNGTSKDDLNKHPSVMRLLQFIRAEKPHFQALIEPSDLSSFYIVKPKLSNRRILAQSGAFVVFGLTSKIPWNYVDTFSIEKILISGSSKTKILDELERVGTHESALFPEIERAAKYVRSKVS